MFTKRIFISLFNSIKDNKQLIKLLRPYFCYFKNGLYCIDHRSRIIYKASEFRKFQYESIHTYDGYYACNNKKNILRSLASFFLHKKILTIRNKKNTFCYSLGIVNLERDSIKLFDYQQNLVATFYLNPKKQHMILANRYKLTELGYSAPDLYSTFEFTDCYPVVERLIKKRDYDFDDGLICWLKNVIAFSSSSNNRIIIKRLSIKKRTIIKSFLYTHNFLKELEMFNELVEKKWFSIIFCHGDFYQLNYIYDGTKYYTIDYECACYKFLMFDFFTYIAKSFLIFEDKKLIECYFNGAYDSFLYSYFKNNKSCYKNNFKSLYFLICLIETYNYKLSSGFTTVYNIFIKNFANYFHKN